MNVKFLTEETFHRIPLQPFLLRSSKIMLLISHYQQLYTLRLKLTVLLVLFYSAFCFLDDFMMISSFNKNLIERCRAAV